MARFTIPREIYFGPGALEELRHLRGYSRAFLIAGQTLRRQGILRRATDLLCAAGCACHLSAEVEVLPTIETVERGAAEMRAFAPDVIVALGGGSVLDAAKAMWVFYEYPERTLQSVRTPFTLPHLRQKAHFIAVSSTSGVGSEVTAFSFVSGGEPSFQHPLLDFEITPDVAILDPDLTVSMSPERTALSGFSALANALEALVGTGRSSFTDPLALAAVELIFDHLQNSCLGDSEARSGMQHAQCLAGMALANAHPGVLHALAHKAIPSLGQSFGHLSAALLPHVIHYNAFDVAPLYARAARRLGLPGGSDNQLVFCLIRAVCELSAAVGLPSDLASCGLSEQRFLACRKQIAHAALADPSVSSNPRHTDETELLALLDAAYYGCPAAL